MARESPSPLQRIPKHKNRRKTPTHARARQVLADMRRDPSLTLNKAARKRRIDPRTVRELLPTDFRKDASGRVRARSSKPRRKTLYIPSTSPGVSVPVATRNRRERLLLGRWMAALNAAGRGDWSKMRKFRKGQRVGGVLLETDASQVQEILNALAEEESPYEGLYRAIARPR